MMKKIVTIGEYLIDMMPIDHGFQPKPGGAPMNVAVAIHRLNGHVTPIAQVGHDLFGRMLKDTLVQEGMDVSYISIDDHHKTSLAFVSLDEHGERQFMFYRDPSADQFLSLDLKMIEKIPYDIIHFGSVGLAKFPLKESTDLLIEDAIKNNKIISFDVNVRLMLVKDEQQHKTTIKKYIQKSNLIKCSYEEVVYLLGEEKHLDSMVSTLFQLENQMVIVTDGEKGVHLYYQDHKFYQEAFQVEVIDTTGAGDAFMGAFLWSLSKEQFPFLKIDWVPKALEIASYVGALTVTKKGAMEALPNYHDILRLF
jgi:fructokinase